MDEKDLGDDLEKVLISQEQIAQRLREMAAEIEVDYRDRDLLLVGVLKGALMVMADLSARHVGELDRLVTDWHGQGPLHLPGRVAAERRCGRLHLTRRP